MFHKFSFAYIGKDCFSANASHVDLHAKLLKVLHRLHSTVNPHKTRDDAGPTEGAMYLFPLSLFVTDDRVCYFGPRRSYTG